MTRALCNRVVERADERDETDRRTVIGFSRNRNGTQPLHLSFVKTTLWIGVKRVFTVAIARTEVSRLVFYESEAHLNVLVTTGSAASTRNVQPAGFSLQ